jgi:hypothetical protein
MGLKGYKEPPREAEVLTTQEIAVKFGNKNPDQPLKSKSKDLDL